MCGAGGDHQRADQVVALELLADLGRGGLGHLPGGGAQWRGGFADRTLDARDGGGLGVVVASVEKILKVDLDRIGGQRQPRDLHSREIQRTLQPRNVLDGRHLFAQLLHASVVRDARRHVVARRVAHFLVQVDDPFLELRDVHAQADQFIDGHAQPPPHGNERVHPLESGIGLGLQAGDLFQEVEQVGIDNMTQHQRGMIERNG
ncbi:hypothetical protein FQZ97_776100 [compost metagenome]